LQINKNLLHYFSTPTSPGVRGWATDQRSALLVTRNRFTVLALLARRHHGPRPGVCGRVQGARCLVVLLWQVSNSRVVPRGVGVADDGRQQPSPRVVPLSWAARISLSRFRRISAALVPTPMRAVCAPRTPEPRAHVAQTIRGRVARRRRSARRPGPLRRGRPAEPWAPS
jgi:hypothetical protein